MLQPMGPFVLLLMTDPVQQGEEKGVFRVQVVTMHFFYVSPETFLCY